MKKLFSGISGIFAMAVLTLFIVTMTIVSMGTEYVGFGFFIAALAIGLYIWEQHRPEDKNT